MQNGSEQCTGYFICTYVSVGLGEREKEERERRERPVKLMRMFYDTLVGHFDHNDQRLEH